MAQSVDALNTLATQTAEFGVNFLDNRASAWWFGARSVAATFFDETRTPSALIPTAPIKNPLGSLPLRSLRLAASAAAASIRLSNDMIYQYQKVAPHYTSEIIFIS